MDVPRVLQGHDVRPGGCRNRERVQPSGLMYSKDRSQVRRDEITCLQYHVARSRIGISSALK
jgi:hypothetical protein